MASTFVPNVPARWWFLPWTSLATAPPSVTKRVPGVVGRNQPCGTMRLKIWDRLDACLCAQSAGRRVEADEPVKAGRIYDCARPVEAGVAVGAAQPDRELFRHAGRGGVRRVRRETEVASNIAVAGPPDPTRRYRSARGTGAARSVALARSGLADSHPCGARLRHAAATMMKAIARKKADSPGLSARNMIGSSSMRRRSAKINARPTQ